MANQNERIQISCSYAEYRLIHQAVMAAAKRAKAQDDHTSRRDLMNVMLRLGEAEGITSHHLSDLTLWDVD